MDTSKICYGCFNTHDGNGPCPHCGYDLATAKHPFVALPIGTILNGRYLTGRVLGVGGFGVTYLAFDMTLEISVAVKEFLPSGIALRDSDRYTMTVSSPEEQPKFDAGADKFLDEARLLAKLRDVPNIVTVQDYFRENNTAYFVMEYIDGVDLMKYTQTRGGKLSFEEALQLLLPIIDSLAHVHAHNLLHRDISPDNIVVMKNGSTRLLDFGAARMAIDTEKSKSIILKHGFAPEEQYRKHGNQGPWSDEYALAATMYLIITGVMPPDAIERVHEDTLASPISLGVQMPQYANDALMKALAVNASGRFPDMGSFSAAITGREPSGYVAPDDNPDAMVAGKTVAMDEPADLPESPDKVISPSILAGQSATEQKTEQTAAVAAPKAKKSIWKKPLTYVLIGVATLAIAAIPTGIYISQNYEWVTDESEETTKKKPRSTKSTTKQTQETTLFADPAIADVDDFKVYSDESRNFSITVPADYAFENSNGIYTFVRSDEQCQVYSDFISKYGNTRLSSLNDFVAVSDDVIRSYMEEQLGYTNLEFGKDYFYVNNFYGRNYSLRYDATAEKDGMKKDITFIVTESLENPGVFLSCGVMALDSDGMYNKDDWDQIASILASFDELTEKTSNYVYYDYSYLPHFTFMYKQADIDQVQENKTNTGLDCLDLVIHGAKDDNCGIRIICLGGQDSITAACTAVEQTLASDYKFGGYTSVTPIVREFTDMRIRNYSLTRIDDTSVTIDCTACIMNLNGEYFAVIATCDDAELLEQVTLDFTMIVKSINT